ncbi:DHA2 family efflux MFS transporter permease subunit [Syntrophomonas palmitatica]|uniref:DHA2 family efflux MFS transporter permease subunit n=1 Tax=Syntrophomonas palmitatica TaxID=402877 RepID=UPI000A6ECAF1|nr:DHA2 family efflux MFS transporter permease subunit [Syntrophomonas palmitatica]
MRPSQDDQKIQWSVISVILIGTFMAVLNGSIVNVALPKIMAIFNATSDSIQWVLTCYLMTLGVVMPVTGFMADRFGYKRMYFIALALFTAGSAICGLAWSINSLIAARIIQAIGGGIMTPLGMAFVYRVVPRNKIGLVMGVWGIAAMAAPAIGPTLGGYLVEYVSWRLIFYVNVPIGIINLVLSSILLSETESIKGKHFDFTGLISSIIGLFCLLLALSQGSKHGWGSPYIVSLFAVAATALSIFVYNELTHPEPLLELRLFKDFQFTVSTLIGITLNIGMFGGMFLFPLLLQSVLGQSAMKTGLIVFPSAIATAVMMPISGRIFDRYAPGE